MTNEGQIRDEISRLCTNFQTSKLADTKAFWGRLASYMAGVCLGPDGSVDIANCNALRAFWAHNLPGFPITIYPYLRVPGIELIRDQVTTVLGKMQNDSPLGDDSSQSLAQVLSDVIDEDMRASRNGQRILDKMKSVSINHAILQSLFTPHRQVGLPTCNMDAIIVSETLNNPARLARIFRDILTQDVYASIHLASNNATDEIILSPVLGNLNFISMEVRPTKPQDGYNQFFLLNENLEKGLEGIGLIRSNINSQIIGLDIPINDLNDALLANLMQNVYGEPQGVIVTEGFVRSRQLYFGVDGAQGFLDRILHDPVLTENRCFRARDITGKESTKIYPTRYFNLESMQALVGQAQGLLRAGITVASTMFSQPSKVVPPSNIHAAKTTKGTPFNLDKINGHVENLYLQNISKILTMAVDKVHVIGDRNWCDGHGEPTYLAVQKVKKKGQDVFAFTMGNIDRQISPPEFVEHKHKDSVRYGERGQFCIYNQLH
jgi:hypothetical protein